MSDRTYQRFVPQEDNIDTIDANDINELQRALEKTQQEVFVQADASFLTKALLTLEHHPDVNAMLIDLMETSAKFNSSSMVNVHFDEETKSLGFDGSDEAEGSVITKVLANETSKPYRKLILLADEYKPEGSLIEYYISFDDITYLQIMPNQAIPAATENELGQIYIKIRFVRSSSELEPRLDAWALLYEDETYLFRFLDNGLDIGIESDWDGTIIK